MDPDADPNPAIFVSDTCGSGSGSATLQHTVHMHVSTRFWQHYAPVRCDHPSFLAYEHAGQGAARPPPTLLINPWV
jgi:hypothetical protein